MKKATRVKQLNKAIERKNREIQICKEWIRLLVENGIDVGLYREDAYKILPKEVRL